MPHATDELERGRGSYARRAWTDAHEALSGADRAASLGAADLELLATSAYMLGRDDEYVSGLERAHHAYLDGGEELRAARCAFWIGINLILRGEMGPASGWVGRARRLVGRDDRDCVEQGYLLLPLMFEHEAAGDLDAAIAAGADAAAIGERFGDADLFALATHDRGILLIKQGRVVEGLALLDEAMVAVTAGELSPIVNGFVYCGVITGCQAAYEARRAQEWTAALTRWCEQQPDMVAFSGTCLVHRAEIMQLRGAWPDALQEARRAGQRCALAMNESAAAQALYRQGELHRLQGEFAAAEEAYRDASRGGYEPQPGLALLRLAQGDHEAAAAAIRRAVGETSEPSKLVGLLPAQVEIMLAVGDARSARSACGRARGDRASAGRAPWLRRSSPTLGERSTSPRATPGRRWSRCGTRARRGESSRLPTRRHALACWWPWPAPGSVTTTRRRWSSRPPVRSSHGSERRRTSPASTRSRAAPCRARPHGLTARELQVLRLVAAGETNKAIAAELVLSQRTVDRHVSNIFAKLGVSSRAAATAYAYEHRVV